MPPPDSLQSNDCPRARTFQGIITMDSVILNKTKSELYAAQEKTLNSAQESHVKLTASQEEIYANQTAEIAEIDKTLVRMKAIETGKAQISMPTSEIFVPKNTKRFNAKPDAEYSNCTKEYADALWKSV